jgi:dipeptidyl aminopeptidase/acylaminoacyl peptidase
VAVGRNAAWYNAAYGPLATVPASGGAPRDLLDDVSTADWLRDGRTLAIVHRVGGEDRLEMPPGHVLTRSAGQIRDPRVSPDGGSVAFTEHPVPNDGRGSVALVDATGRKKVLTGEFENVLGLAWSPSGREIWFSASESGWDQGLLAVTRSGRLREVARLLGSVWLKDVAADGRVLLTSRRMQASIRGRLGTDEAEKELGWLDFSLPKALSADGRRLLFDDEGQTSGHTYTAYLRGADESLPVRLEVGSACALSPDGKWALAVQYGPPPRLIQIPTGSGDTLSLARGPVESFQGSARYLPDGRGIVFEGSERGRPQRTWIQEIPAGTPRPVTPEGTSGTVVSPDGRWVAATTPDTAIVIFPLHGGAPRPLGKLAYWESVSQWSADGRTLLVYRSGMRLELSTIDVLTGRRRPWRTIEAPDPAGVYMGYFLVTPDQRSYAYGYLRFLDELYLVEGLK